MNNKKCIKKIIGLDFKTKNETIEVYKAKI